MLMYPSGSVFSFLVKRNSFHLQPYYTRRIIYLLVWLPELHKKGMWSGSVGGTKTNPSPFLILAYFLLFLNPWVPSINLNFCTRKRHFCTIEDTKSAKWDFIRRTTKNAAPKWKWNLRFLSWRRSSGVLRRRRQLVLEDDGYEKKRMQWRKN